MASIKNLAWLRAKLSRKLNFNSTQTDQDFAGPTSNAFAMLDDYINEAYVSEVAGGKIEFGLSQFQLRQSFTWAASAVTKTVPQNLRDQQIIRLEDTTNQSPGELLWVGNDGGMSTTIFWADYSTLQWGSVGPGSARTITAFYVASAVEMENAIDEPWLIPPDHRYLLLWSAACIARAESDERAPEEWLRQRDEYRSKYYSLLARGTITYPLGSTILEPAGGGVSATVSTTAGIGGGIG